MIYIYNWSTNLYELLETVSGTALSASNTINITKNFSLLLSASNMTDETYHQYFLNQNAGSVLADEYKFGRGYSAAVHWNF